MRDFDEFICCVDKMRRERNIGKRKGSQKISLYFVQSLGNEKEKETREQRERGGIWEEERF